MLNNDQQILMVLLTKAYLFSNNADVSEGEDCSNDLPAKYVSEICSLIEPVMRKIIDNDKVYEEFQKCGCEVGDINHLFGLYNTDQLK